MESINLTLGKLLPKFDAKTAIKQDFPYPSSIMYYIKQNLKNVFLYFKFIRVCKYFYSPTDPVPYFNGTNLNNFNIGQKLIMGLFHGSYILSLNDLKNIDKIWLNTSFCVDPDTLPLSFYSCLLEKLYRNDILCLWIFKQKISFSDFKLLTSSKNLLDLTIWSGGSIRQENNVAEVPLDEILKCVPKLRRLDFWCPDECSTKRVNVNNIVAILNPLKLKHFALKNIVKPFDFETFSAFMKKNPHIQYDLSFADEYPLQNEYIQKLQNFVNEIIAAGESKNPPPQIYFHGLSQEDKKILKALFKKYRIR
jgi:hypothetical protein